MDEHQGEFQKEYSLEEFEELKFIAEVTPFQDTVVAAETSDKPVEENMIIVDQTPQGENAEGTNAEKEENTTVRVEASDKNPDEKLVMVEPIDGQIAEKSNQTTREDTSPIANASDDNNVDGKTTEEGQNKIENSTKGKEKIDMANLSIVGKGESSGGANDDDTHADKMALITVPLDQGENIGQSSAEQAKIGESSQVPKVTIISRAISHLPLHLRLRGWQIREHPRRDLKRKDKFYVHLQSDVQFRSLNEVDDFVQWGLHPKRQIKKPLLVDPQNSGLQQAAKEGPPTKRSTRRKLAWEFYNRKFITEGIAVCDINFPGATDDVMIEHDTGSRGSQETGSSERTMSVKSSDPVEEEEEEEEEEEKDDNGEDEEEDDDEEEEEGYTEAEVRAFFAEAYENLRNVRPKDESPQQQQMNNYEAAASSSSESTSSTTPTASTDAGGKRTQKDDDLEEGPSSKKPRV